MIDCCTPTDKNDIPVLGIDLGTRFSCVSIWRNKKFEIITDNFGNRTIPSVVSFHRSARLVGYNALSMKDVSPGNTIYDVKRIIGRRFNDPTIEQTQSLVSYEIIDDESSHHNALVQLDKTDVTLSQKTTYRPEEICSYILAYIKKTAAEYLKLDAVARNDLKATITVPAYFNDAQRQATLDAAKIAGLNVIKIINEPTAAALAYGLGNRSWKNKESGGNIIMYDFGAGTLDVSLINVKDGIFKTLAVGGNTHLGGEDVDYVIMNHLIFEFKKQFRVKELRISKLTQIRLKNAVENGKKILSSTDKTVICLDDFYNGQRLYYVLTRDVLDAICNDLFIMCMKPLSDVLESAGLTKNDIDDIVMVGGSTRIPKIQSLIINFFNGTSIKNVTTSINPDEVVSAGASIYGYIMTHNDDPFSENLVLLDITPLSLGVETLKKRMTVVIPRNTVIPIRKIKTFSTDEDDQDEVSIKIFEGERKLTKNNFHVGTFDLCGFKKAPRGHPVIKITFQVDINGILQVTAYEKKSGVQNSIQITSTWGAKGRLSKGDIDELISDAEKNDQIDMMYSTKIGLIDEIQSLCNSVSCNIIDNRFNLTKTDQKKIKMDVTNHMKWLADTKFDDLMIDDLEKRLERLKNLYSPLMAHSNKNNENFSDRNAESNVAEIHGDDDDNENLQQYEKIELPDDPSRFDKEEIKSLKKTIFELGKNIVSVINNPVSKFDQEDVIMMTDYVSSVNIWLYTTNAQTSIEFVAKINEMNKMTEEVMSKYDPEHELFQKNEDFTIRDELQLTCLTLNMSIRNNYFSLGSCNTDKLTKLINDTMIWAVAHQNESPDVYKSKLNEINELCNDFHHSMSKINITPIEEEPESDSDETTYPVPENNKINESINLMIDSLPDKITRRKPVTPKKTDVLLKIDVSKFA